MFFSLLGRVTWAYLRLRYGRLRMPRRPVFAGGALALLLAVALLGQRSHSN